MLPKVFVVKSIHRKEAFQHDRSSARCTENICILRGTHVRSVKTSRRWEHVPSIFFRVRPLHGISPLYHQRTGKGCQLSATRMSAAGHDLLVNKFEKARSLFIWFLFANNFLSGHKAATQMQRTIKVCIKLLCK